MSDAPHVGLLAEHLRSVTDERDALRRENAQLLRRLPKRTRSETGETGESTTALETSMLAEETIEARLRVGVLLRAIAAVCNVQDDLEPIEAYSDLQLFKWATDTMQSTIRRERAEARNQHMRGVASLDVDDQERKRQSLMSRLQHIVQLSNEVHGSLLADRGE